jgi:hypothetical protein
MDTTRVKIEDVARGSMIPGWSGVTIAETLSADERGVFWHGTDGGRHYADINGLMVVFVPTVRTQQYGRTRMGVQHALLPQVPNEPPRGLCAASRCLELAVWESGIALSGVTCNTCRRMLSLAPNAPRQSNGI